MNFYRLAGPIIAVIVVAASVYNVGPSATTTDFVVLLAVVAGMATAFGGIVWCAFDILDAVDDAVEAVESGDFDLNPDGTHPYITSPQGGAFEDKP